jgi:2-dehydro-3-deoxygluconokinase
MPRDITALGPLNIDLLMVGQAPLDWDALLAWEGPAHMEMVAAGSVGYCVSDLAKLGLDVAVCSCVPDDSLGAFIVDSLQRDGVDVRAVQRVPGTLTGIGAYLLLFGSRKRPLAYRMPTHTPWPQDLSPATSADLLDARWLHCGGYLHFANVWHGSTVALFCQARARGLVTSLDTQFPLAPLDPPWMRVMNDILPHVQILFCDETEARHLVACDDLSECGRALLDAGPEILVIKQGAAGATLFRRGWSYHQPAIHLGELVDSIGAGDAFDAGFLYGVLQGWPAEQTALFAAVAAAFTVTGVGGSASFPSVEQIQRAMAERSFGDPP